MARPPLPLEPEYLAARRGLLDALEALAAHRSAIVVVGAQAIYLRTGRGITGIAPYTTDGDLALDPALLDDEPQLEVAMAGAGFKLYEPLPNRPEPGVWVERVMVSRREVRVQVDLIVPEGAASGGGRRGARLGAHGKRAARRATGLEGALVDHSAMKITALDETDLRSFEVAVAKPPALLIAKVHKIHDRVRSPRADRADDKDAADVYRLMQATRPSEVAARIAHLRRDPLAGPATDDAIGYLFDLFGRRGATGITMAVRALRLAIPEDEIIGLATAYVQRLRNALEGSG